MAGEWRSSTWGEEISLEYGKRLTGYTESDGPVRVFGTNGPVGWTDEPLAPGPGVIVGRKGAYRGVHYSPEPFYVIDTAYFVRPKTDLDMRWLYYAIIHHKVTELNDGSPIPSTTRSAVYIRELDVPPRPEQEAIADILGSLDDKIELNRRMNRTLEAMARAIFKAWFVDFEPVKAKAAGATRFRGMPQAIFGQLPDRFTDTELGPVPEGWEIKPLDEIADFLNGLALRKYPASDPDDSLPVIKIAELRNGISEKSGRASREIPEKYIVKDGDFLFSWSGSLLAKFWTQGAGALNQHLFKVTSQKYPMWFVTQWVYEHICHFRAIAESKATTMGHIQRKHLKEALTVCVTDNLLRQMDGVISPIVEQAIVLELESRTLAAMRDTLLPKLISGELRVSVGEGSADGE